MNHLPSFAVKKERYFDLDVTASTNLYLDNENKNYLMSVEESQMRKASDFFS